MLFKVSKLLTSTITGSLFKKKIIVNEYLARAKIHRQHAKKKRKLSSNFIN